MKRFVQGGMNSSMETTENYLLSSYVQLMKWKPTELMLAKICAKNVNILFIKITGQQKLKNIQFNGLNST